MLYSGFFDDQDKKLMAQIRRSSPQELAVKRFPFKDARLGELLFRYRARNFPDSLSQQELSRWRDFCQLRLTDVSAGASLIRSDFDKRIATLMDSSETTPQQKLILKELLDYADKLVAGKN
jgi:exodeoxyribonuclease-1